MATSDLTEFEKSVIEKQGTEPPFTGLYNNLTAEGTYHCKKCDALLYKSENKFDSGCGWPSFDEDVSDAVERRRDPLDNRTEIVCKSCGGHLGHVFHGEKKTPKDTRHCVNSVSIRFKPKPSNAYSTIVLAAGCFWGVEYQMARLKGVIRTVAGYSGGTTEKPTYKEVCNGDTGHLECVEVTYDPQMVTLEQILKLFFEVHDFSQANGQGPDIGPQYLSAIFVANESERRLAEDLIERLKRSQSTTSVCTQVKNKCPFWPAEPYHQNYLERAGPAAVRHSCHRRRQIFFN